MTADIFAKLAAPFDPAEVDWRIGHTNADKTKGMALAYIDARAVMERLDAVVGPSGWKNSYPHASTKTVCRIEIKIGDEWIWKEDGAGDSDFEAEKGALSDAFKRAAVRWGVGRYLYDLASPWVPIEAKGKSHFITAEGKRTLDNLLRTSRVVQMPQAQTMVGRKNEAKGVSEAREWVNAAIAAINKKRTMKELDAWLLANEKTLPQIEEIVPDEYAALQSRIASATERLNVLQAG